MVWISHWLEKMTLTWASSWPRWSTSKTQFCMCRMLSLCVCRYFSDWSMSVLSSMCSSSSAHSSSCDVIYNHTSLVNVCSFLASYPVLRIAKIAPHFTPRQISPIKYCLNVSRTHSASLQLICIRTQISTTVYSQVLVPMAERPGATNRGSIGWDCNALATISVAELYMRYISLKISEWLSQSLWDMLNILLD